LNHGKGQGAIGKGLRLVQQVSHSQRREELYTGESLLKKTLLLERDGIMAHNSILAPGTLKSAETFGECKDNLVLFHPSIANNEVYISRERW
jgi:hypothetical protein